MQADLSSAPAAPSRAASRRQRAPSVDCRPIAELRLYERNARTHSPAQIERVKASIVEFGWTVPVLVDASGVVAGHARIAAATLAYSEGLALLFPDGGTIPVGTVPVLVCDGWTDAKRRAYILADNQLALGAGWDDELLADELAVLKAGDFDLSLLGFSEAELTALLAPADSPPPAAKAAADFQYQEKFAVLVECAGEANQAEVYERLVADGYTCRVLVN
jgi:ParB-like chromosome segregation protein Spo0J